MAHDVIAQLLRPQQQLRQRVQGRGRRPPSCWMECGQRTAVCLSAKERSAKALSVTHAGEKSVSPTPFTFSVPCPLW